MLMDHQRTGDLRWAGVVDARPWDGEAALRVARDMERIFGATAQKPRAPHPVTPIALERRGGTAWLLGGAAMLTLLLLAGFMAAWIMRDSAPGPIVARAETLARAQPETPQAASAPAPREAPPPARPPAAKPPMAAIEPAAAPRNIAPATRRADAARPLAMSAARPAPAVARSVRPVQPGIAASCSRLSRPARAACMRPQFISADQALRTAFTRAERAGVSPDMLDDYQRRWTRLLDDYAEDPRYVTNRLRKMARQLDDERTQA